MHTPGADVLLAVALIGGFAFAVLALWEILPSSISTIEKLMWMVGFIFLNWLAAVLYLAVGRKRVKGLRANNYRVGK
jgi:hypothetical protein